MDKELLYNRLKAADLLYQSNKGALYGTALSYYSGFWRETVWAKALDEETKRRYALCLDMNSMKFALAAKSLCRPMEKEALSAAVSFILAGCLLDNFIDQGSAAERKQAMEMLEWEYCAHYFVHFGSAKSKHAIDVLFSEIAHYLKDKARTEPKAYDQFLAYLRRATAAEVASANGRDDALQNRMIVDKSVLFEVLGFQLAFYGNHTCQEWEIFFLIGNIFWMIDDLCDVEEDTRSGQVNALLSAECGSLEVRMTRMLTELTQALERLKLLVEPAFYQFILYEVRSWTLDEPGLYRKVMEAP